ncbi:MAG: hypothetical protein ABJC19_10145 [Gemmatimonadota bacterium]
MRITPFASIPFALMLATAPAQAQVSVGVHIDIPIIGHGTGGDYRRGPVREVRVYEYPPVPYGKWKKYSRNWHREQLYIYDGRYYDYPVRGGRVVYVYRDQDRYFWGPGDGRWDRWDRWDRGRDDRYGRDDRDDRYRRDDRDGRDVRYRQGTRYDQNRNGRDDRYESRSYPGPGRVVVRTPPPARDMSRGQGGDRNDRSSTRRDNGNGNGKGKSDSNPGNGRGRGNGRARN